MPNDNQSLVQCLPDIAALCGDQRGTFNYMYILLVNPIFHQILNAKIVEMRNLSQDPWLLSNHASCTDNLGLTR